MSVPPVTRALPPLPPPDRIAPLVVDTQPGAQAGPGDEVLPGGEDDATANSPSRVVLPAVPPSLSEAFCLLNCFVPGLGTFFSSISCCCARTRGMTKSEVAASIVVGMVIALFQLLLTPVLLVGWIWSCFWGVLLTAQSDAYFKPRDEQERSRRILNIHPTQTHPEPPPPYTYYDDYNDRTRTPPPPYSPPNNATTVVVHPQQQNNQTATTSPENGDVNANGDVRRSSVRPTSAPVIVTRDTAVDIERPTENAERVTERAENVTEHAEYRSPSPTVSMNSDSSVPTFSSDSSRRESVNVIISQNPNQSTNENSLPDVC